MRAVGQSDSTRESDESRRREAERGTFSQAPAVQGNIEEETLAIHRGGKEMGTKLERISQLSRENPDIEGRPSFPPSNMAKMYLYGNRNGIRSSRKLFPWRYLGIAIVFLTVLLGELLDLVPESLWNISGELFKAILSVVCVIMVCRFSNHYCNNMNVVNYYETAELNNKRIMSKVECLIVNTDRNLQVFRE